jgi:hypothetical protein
MLHNAGARIAIIALVMSAQGHLSRRCRARDITVTYRREADSLASRISGELRVRQLHHSVRVSVDPEVAAIWRPSAATSY